MNVTMGGAPLRDLAKIYGLQASYYDVDGVRRTATPEAMVGVLRGLGVQIESLGDIDDAVRARRIELAQRVVEPVIVAWDGRLPDMQLRLPASVGGSAVIEIDIEQGRAISRTIGLARLKHAGEEEIEGKRYTTSILTIRDRLPAGYHRLIIRAGRHRGEALVISGPRQAYAENGRRDWGVFLPLYALRTGREWGAGDVSDLRELVDWTADVGGHAVATLPLFAAYLDKPFDPSPYSPASRLFWNEFYIDIESVPELVDCAAARELIASGEVQEEIGALRRGDIVDYRAGMALKRRVLELLAKNFSCNGALRTFLRDHPHAEDYARFRATVEARGEPWGAWPERLRDGTILDSDFDEAVMRYHLYVQLIAWEQVNEVSRAAVERNVRLYFDMPLGVSADSYDVWRERESFATGLSGGAPPDAFFSWGQNWGFPPAHPDNMRKSGYAYWIAALRQLMGAAGAIRIDHVMGFHRLYCIPAETDARSGLYVRYHPEELYAILALESHRNNTIVVGEDLGTVPKYVRPAMRRHNVHRTYVAQFQLSPKKGEPLPEPPRLSVSSLNTHDMPPFAGFWNGSGIDDSLALGHLTDEEAAERHKKLAMMRRKTVAHLRQRGLLGKREMETRDVLRALLVALGESRTALVLANLEDLWLETLPQNVPGTTEERINWRRKARSSLEDMRQSKELLGPVLALAGARTGMRRK
ncbi:MAG: 4-alpha-glucanotransferase [Dehalococcoidia bacterium]